jgi:SAM-dependent methyltransferase
MADPADEIARGKRFGFGANWQRFARQLDPERIAAAEASLREMLQLENLAGRRFLDVGAGSGLFSLAARRLGATVVSFDFDPQAVACVEQLRQRHFPDDSSWRVRQGDVLDRALIDELGRFDVVYAWGVLHHTGDLWRALDHACALVDDSGLLFVAIYNRQPLLSPVWLQVKRLYNALPTPGRALLAGGSTALAAAQGLAADVLAGRNPLVRYRGDDRRGMSVLWDAVDWVGGFPFEVATAEEVFRFVRDRGFELCELRTANGRHGCNELVCRRTAAAGNGRPQPATGRS